MRFFILAMDDAQYSALYKSLKRLLAIAEIQNDRGLLESLTKESQNELKKKLNDAEKEIPFRILNAYRHLALCDEKDWSWKDLGIPTVGTNVTISERVNNILKTRRRFSLASLPNTSSTEHLQRMRMKRYCETSTNSSSRPLVCRCWKTKMFYLMQ